jgi:tRNA dimethylallyltransferase
LSVGSAGGRLRVICGPTAAGKSAIAHALADRYAAAIISADSRQIYRGFDIGTAKPTAAERRRVPYYGIDVVEPTARYSAAEWAEAAEGWLADAARAGCVPVVVGGTGFYLRALTAPLFEAPPLDAARRRALEAALARRGTAELRRWCERVDPARAHLGRAQLARAIEVATLTGVPISAWHRHDARAPRVSARYLLVDPGAALRERIAARVGAMLAAGWVEEARRLDECVPPGAPAWNATGYEAVREVARGRLSLGAAAARVALDTRRYAKRQRTWFRHQLRGDDVTLLDPLAPDAVERAAQWWDATADG